MTASNIYTQRYLVGVQARLAHPKPRCFMCHCGRSTERSSHWLVSSKDKDSETRWILYVYHVKWLLLFKRLQISCHWFQVWFFPRLHPLEFLRSIPDGRLFQQRCAAAAWKASSFSSTNVQYCLQIIASVLPSDPLRLAATDKVPAELGGRGGGQSQFPH